MCILIPLTPSLLVAMASQLLETQHSDYAVVAPTCGSQARTIYFLSDRVASLSFQGGLKGKMRSQ